MFAERYQTRNIFLSNQRLACSIHSSDLSGRFYGNVSLQITGKWYVVEVLEHMLTKPISSSYIVDSCPIVRLSQLENQPNILRLLWTEESGSVEYSFVIHDINRRKGLWRTMTMQNGKISFISTRSSKL